MRAVSVKRDMILQTSLGPAFNGAIPALESSAIYYSCDLGVVEDTLSITSVYLCKDASFIYVNKQFFHLLLHRSFSCYIILWIAEKNDMQY